MNKTLLLVVLSLVNLSSSSTTPPSYTRVSEEDDEIHDEEILKAVQTSLYEFYSKKNVSSNRVKRGIKMVCYGVLGCFRDEGVFDYLDMVPAPPEEINTKFMVYSRESKEPPEVYTWDNYTATGSTTKFNSSRVTKIIVHGFGSTCNRMWASEMRQAMLAVVDCNVICVDWEAGAALPNYVRAAVNTRLVGKQLSLFVSSLNSVHGSKNEEFHLIGFSLGAHVAGFAGSELKNLSRITGLDPAGPLFESYDPKVRLDASDALFVDVIHSNGDSLLMGGLGSWEQIGHLDFYPNGGRAQKGCSHMFLGAFRDLIWSAPTTTPTVSQTTTAPLKKLRMRMLPLDPLQPPPPPSPPPETDGRSLCNHRRAYKFFTESVSPRCQFPAFFCESFDKYLTGTCFHGVNAMVPYYTMGYYADIGWKQQQQIGGSSSVPIQEKNKLLYLATRDNEPFCANQYRIRVESSPSPAPISTYGGLEAVMIGTSGGGAGSEGSVVEVLNNTFLVTQTPKDNMVAGSVLQRLVVAHPALTTPVKVILKYTAYQGWLYSGISRWSMDRLLVTDPRGVSWSFCTRGLLLPSGISVTIQLTPGTCTNHPSAPLQPPPPNYPNYPYETYNNEETSDTSPNLTNLSKLLISNSSMDYSEWQPINGSSSENTSTIEHHHHHQHVHHNHHHSRLSYVTKQVIPTDIDNILHEHESVSPSGGASVPTRLLLGTTRSLKSRPIVLRNRSVREGRTIVDSVQQQQQQLMYFIPPRRYSKTTKHHHHLHHHHVHFGGSSSAPPPQQHSNEHAMRQVGMKMMLESTGVVGGDVLGDIVSLPTGPIHGLYKRGKQFGLVALRRRKKKRV